MSEQYDIVAMGDNHGDLACEDTLDAIMQFVATVKPKYRVHLGDNWDFRAIRRGADDTDQASSLQRDWDEGEEFIRAFFKFGQERIFLRGNHDERIFDMSTNVKSGVARDYALDGCTPTIQRRECIRTARSLSFTATEQVCTEQNNTPMPMERERFYSDTLMQ